MTESGLAGSYPTVLADDGARHAVGTLFLGESIDAEEDGPTGCLGRARAERAATQADEDGVIASTSILAASGATSTSSFAVVASAAAIEGGNGKLDAWIDFNRDGDWDDSGEQVFERIDMVAGHNLLSFTVPIGANAGETYARFRISSAGGLSAVGAAYDGEVEDHRVTILAGDTPAAVSTAIPPRFDPLTVELNTGRVRVEAGVVELFGAPHAAVDTLTIRDFDRWRFDDVGHGT